jgi:hypothetical protein
LPLQAEGYGLDGMPICDGDNGCHFYAPAEGVS